DRTTDRPAELVPLEVVAGGGERISSIENSVTKKLEDVSMEFVCSRFRDAVDRGRRMVAVLRRKRTRLHFEFLQSVGERERQVQIVVGIVVRCAVEEVRHAVG